MGNLADLGLGDIFQIVSLSRRSGTLQLTTPSRSGEVVFDNGRVVAVFVTGDRPTVGEHLLSSGVIPATTYQEMLAEHGDGTSVADLLAKFGVEMAKAEDALEQLLKETIYQMFDWEEGTFSFVLEERPDPTRGFSFGGTRVALPHGLNPQYLAIEGARLRDERTKEDALESFLARDRPRPAPLGKAKRGAEAETFAAGLRVDDEPPGAGSSADKVIPFPKPRARRDEPAGERRVAQAAPAVDRPPPSEPAPVVRQTPAAPVWQPPPAPPAAPVAPVAPVEAAAPAAVAPAGEPTEPAVRPVSRHRLLVIDDDPQVTRVLHQVFAERFAAVIIANSVRDAIPEIEQAQAGLVVASDLIIARSDGGGILGGIEILERVRARAPDVPVVLFTDYENAEAQERARRLGVLGFLVKPRKAQIQASKDPASSGALQPFLTAIGELLTPFTPPPEPVPSAPPADAASPSLDAPSGAPETVAAPPADAASPPLDAPSGSPEAVAAAVPALEAQAVAAVQALRSATEVGMPYDLRREFAPVIEEVDLPVAEGLPPRRDSGGPVDVLRSMLAELLDPANRETVTLLVLRFASLLFERAILFLVTRRAFVGLGGFSTEEPSDRFVARVRKIQISVEEPSLFAQVVKYRAGYRGPLAAQPGNERLMRGVGGSWPGGDAAAIPLLTNNRVAAVLFGDNPSGRELPLTDTLEIFLQQAGLAMERVLLERKLDEARRRNGEPQDE